MLSKVVKIKRHYENNLQFLKLCNSDDCLISLSLTLNTEKKHKILNSSKLYTKIFLKLYNQ